MSDKLEEVALSNKLNVEMNFKLRENAHKTHWRLTPRDDLMRGLYEEMLELEAAIERGHSPADVWAEAADVANFAAMLADNYEAGGHLIEGGSE